MRPLYGQRPGGSGSGVPIAPDGVLRLDEGVHGRVLADLPHLADPETDRDVAGVVLESEVPERGGAQVEALWQVDVHDGLDGEQVDRVAPVVASARMLVGHQATEQAQGLGRDGDASNAGLPAL